MKFVVFFSIFLSLNAHALVDMRNANFSDPWIDIEVKGTGFDMSVRRTYNSRTLHNGIFGFGWCSSFETILMPQADGTLKLVECGAGDETVFYPQNFKQNDVKLVVADIIKKMKASGVRYTEKYYNDLSDQLFNDPNKREELAAEYKVSASIQEGTIFQANLKSVDRIVFTKNEFVRKLTDGSQQNFSKAGRLVKFSDTNSNFLNFVYNSKGVLEKVIDNNARQLNFTFNSAGKVARISAPNNQSSSYEYNGQDLVKITNSWKNTYTYQYDDLHNLTQINLPDKTKKVITYDKNKDWVTGFTHRDGCQEDYKYESNPKNPIRHYWSILKKTCKGKVVNQSRYEFLFKPSKTGQGDYLAKVSSEVNGLKNEAEYHPLHERPIYTKEGDIVTRYEYFDNGMVKTQKVGNVLTSFNYNKTCNKVSEVKSGKTTTLFSYDGKCNLSTAKNSQGLAVKLDYDRNGRIVGLIDQAKRKVLISYDSKIGKPSVLERPGVGTLNVVYKDNGEIAKVDSKDGPAVALQVARAFNNLVELIRSAGIELGI